jgi:hypothetical protein
VLFCVSISELLEFDTIIKSWDFLTRYDNLEIKYLLEIWKNTFGFENENNLIKCFQNII